MREHTTTDEFHGYQTSSGFYIHQLRLDDIAVRVCGCSGYIHTIWLCNRIQTGPNVSVADVSADAEGVFWTAALTRSCYRKFILVNQPFTIVYKSL